MKDEARKLFETLAGQLAKANCEDTIRTQSRRWTKLDWESYLETIETPLDEVLLAPKVFDKMAEAPKFWLFDFAQENTDPIVKRQIERVLKTLTTQQRRVLELIFIQSKTTRETALELGISQSRVRDLKRLAIRNLRQKVIGGALKIPLVGTSIKILEN